MAFCQNPPVEKTVNSMEQQTTRVYMSNWCPRIPSLLFSRSDFIITWVNGPGLSELGRSRWNPDVRVQEPEPNPVKTLDAPEPHFQEPGTYQRPNAADTYLSETGPPVSIIVIVLPQNRCLRRCWEDIEHLITQFVINIFLPTPVWFIEPTPNPAVFRDRTPVPSVHYTII